MRRTLSGENALAARAMRSVSDGDAALDAPLAALAAGGGGGVAPALCQAVFGLSGDCSFS